MYLIRKCILVLSILKQQENELKKIHESVILKKLDISKKFLCKILYVRKSTLGVRFLVLRTIVDILVLKLLVGNRRADNRVN